MRKGLAILLSAAFFMTSLVFPISAKEDEKLAVVSAEASSTVPGGSVMYAFDGDEATFWQASYDSAFPKWITADLGCVKTVSRVELLFYNAGHAPKDFELLASADGVNYQSVHTVAGNQTGELDIAITPVSARFVKFLCTAGVSSTAPEWAVPTIREMNLYGGAGKPVLTAKKTVRPQEGGEIEIGLSARVTGVSDAVLDAVLCATLCGSDGSELSRYPLISGEQFRFQN